MPWGHVPASPLRPFQIYVLAGMKARQNKGEIMTIIDDDATLAEAVRTHIIRTVGHCGGNRLMQQRHSTSPFAVCAINCASMHVPASPWLGRKAKSLLEDFTVAATHVRALRPGYELRRTAAR
jgi:hypothetical protein